MAVLFLLYVIAEVAAVWAVASQIGVLGTLGLLLAGALVGSWLARREGGKAARAVMATARSGRSPHNEITDGMLVGLGGLLIFLPGFVSDVAGLLLLLPSRALFRRAWMRRLQRRGPIRSTPGTPFGPGMRTRTIVVDSEVVSDDRRRDDGEGGPRPNGRPVIDSE
ncbi:FxsA family protein [Saccharomonospora iraqiensis]|uniref:FxsA family protein n=1 Tax=Saccharomonospora iraqiensis TaxID=52698 RepID=UPI00022E0B34|nr:FxsA family protein [Saccharomonospora iraqiensis]